MNMIQKSLQLYIEALFQMVGTHDTKHRRCNIIEYARWIEKKRYRTVKLRFNLLTMCATAATADADATIVTQMEKRLNYHRLAQVMAVVPVSLPCTIVTKNISNIQIWARSNAVYT